MIDATIARLEAEVTSLANRTMTGLELTELMRRKALPNYTPAAFVIPNGIVGRAASSSENMFLQDAEEVVSIVLVLRSAGDVTGAKSQPALDALVRAVIFALCGWSPADPDPDEDENGTDPTGVFELRRGRVVSLDAGTVFYQLDFAIAQQVRVVS